MLRVNRTLRLLRLSHNNIDSSHNRSSVFSVFTPLSCPSSLFSTNLSAKATKMSDNNANANANANAAASADNGAAVPAKSKNPLANKQPRQPKQQQQQQQQQQSKKGAAPASASSTKGRTLPELFEQRFGQLDAFEYVDTHVHIPLVLERMTAAAANANAKKEAAAAAAAALAAKKAAAAAAAEAAEATPDAAAGATAPAVPEPTPAEVAAPAEAAAPAAASASAASATNSEISWPALAASLPGNYAGCVLVCCEPESFESSMAVLNLDRGYANDADSSSVPVLTVPAALPAEATTYEATHAAAVARAKPAAAATSSGSKLGRMVGAFGIHPHEAKKWNDTVQAQFESAMSHPNVVAWGECGLDYFYDNSPRDLQRAVFITQMGLAVKHGRPLVVHTRDAEDDTVELMTKHLPKHWTVHVHCCTSPRSMVEPLLAHFPNLYVGFTGVVTFPNADLVRDTVACVPLNRILLETDGPFMAPLPFRGALAHPGHVPFTGEKVAEIKGVSVQELFAAARENTRAVYGI